MSAFVCDDKTINRLVAGFSYAKDFGDWNRPTPQPSSALIEIVGDSPAEFGRALYSMNINAVEQCYPDCVGAPDNLPGQCDELGHHVPYKFQTIIPPTPVQFYKTLQTFLYQCSEGDVGELPLYNLLEEYKNKLANHIVSNSKAYSDAEWG